jgi:hypothetical protein
MTTAVIIAIPLWFAALGLAAVFTLYEVVRLLKRAA